MKAIFFAVGLFLFGSGPGGLSRRGPVPIPTADAGPVRTPKRVQKKIFVHLMPWFETKETNDPRGAWGIHWTMVNCHPDSTAPDGRRQIASYYYPLTGPYASGDTDLIEYQLLLMKYSGIDGVCIDWPGTTRLYDYPLLFRNTEKIVSMLSRIGLRYAIVYEDQDINIAFKKGVVGDRIAAARADMAYLAKHCFADTNYERYQGRPLLLDFGPQTFYKEDEWSDIFRGLPETPAFFTLWDHETSAGKNATGAFAWINADNLVSLRRFYGSADAFIASAYPGFRAYYDRGGWGGPTFVIEAHGLTNFSQTLDLALGSRADYVQLPTWNDYGEGTMIEPTREFQYGFLTTLQQRLGVPYTLTQLELISRLYSLRKRYSGVGSVQRILDTASSDLAALLPEKAYALISGLEKPAP